MRPFNDRAIELSCLEIPCYLLLSDEEERWDLRCSIGRDLHLRGASATCVVSLLEDVLAYVPLRGIENSPLGQGPSTAPWWVNLVVGVANFIWNGIVSVARFILDLGRELQ